MTNRPPTHSTRLKGQPVNRSDLDRLVASASALRPAALTALRTIAALERDVDGWPPRGEQSGGRGGGDSSPVERAVLGGGHSPLTLARDRQRLAEGVRDAVDRLDHLLRLAGRYGAPVASSSALRCTGGDGTPGALDWGDPTCTNIAEPGRTTGLCHACRLRRDRWQRQSA